MHISSSVKLFLNLISLSLFFFVTEMTEVLAYAYQGCISIMVLAHNIQWWQWSPGIAWL